jgi:hypothetical protein
MNQQLFNTKKFDHEEDYGYWSAWVTVGMVARDFVCTSHHKRQGDL